MTAPLLAVDAPSLLYRAHFALPSSITGRDGRPVGALLGTANLILRAYDRHRPRAVALCFGAEAARYRTELYPPYHAERPPMPEALAHQWSAAPDFFAAFGFAVLDAGDLEADDLLGSLAAVERRAGGTALLFTGDRDMFQCVTDRVAVLFPVRGADGPELIDAAQVRARYGIDPEQVPDFIALRGDPSDGLPGARGIGEKTARDLLTEHGTLPALLDAARGPISGRTGLRPRVVGTLTDQAEELLRFREIATLRDVPLTRPPDAPLDRRGAADAARSWGMDRLADRLAAASPPGA